MSESAGSKRYSIGGGAAACTVCYAPPMLGLLGIAGAGVVGTAATLAFAGLVFATGRRGGERARLHRPQAAAGPGPGLRFERIRS